MHSLIKEVDIDSITKEEFLGPLETTDDHFKSEPNNFVGKQLGNECPTTDEAMKETKVFPNDCWMAAGYTTELNLPEVRVKLYRLKVDAEGKIIVPKQETGYLKRRSESIQIKSKNSKFSPNKDLKNGEYILGLVPAVNSPKKTCSPSGTKINFCSVCKQQFKTKSFFIRHNCVRDKCKTFKCVTCEKAFVTNSELKVHSRVHSEEMPFKCTVCDRKFRFKANMVEHSRRHTRQDLVYCEVCSKGFVKKSKMLEHYKNVHVNLRPFECPEPGCKRRFNDKYRIQEHVKGVHRRDKSFWKHKCEECDRVFRDKDKLSNHMRIHSGIKPFTCSTCSRSFRTKDILRCHERTHTNEYKYRCGICNQGCATPSQLVKHVENHASKIELKCHICSKTFLHRNGYNFHMKKHKA